MITANDFLLPSQTWATLDGIVAWRERPQFVRAGRTAWYPLDQLGIETGEPVLRALKIKGAGYMSHRGEVHPPSCQALVNPTSHLGFDQDGAFLPIQSVPAPLGALCVDRALQEFEVAQGLLLGGCPAIVPLRVYEYETDVGVFRDPQTGGKSRLGVVVTGYLGSGRARVDDILRYPILYPKTLKEIDQWATSLDAGHPSDLANRVQLLGMLVGLFGRTLRNFSEVGYYRYSGALDNYAYSPNLGTVYLLDLDSSLKLSDASPIEAALQCMRDCASGLAYLVSSLTDPRHFSDFPTALVRDSGLFESYLKGYYYDVQDGTIESLMGPLYDYYSSVLEVSHELSKVSNSKGLRGEQGVEAAETLARGDDDAFRDVVMESFRRPWIKRSEVFCLGMTVCWALHSASLVSRLYPLDMTIGRLIENMCAYAGLDTVWRVSGKLFRLIECSR
jgi:hypothetical protein